MTNVVLFPKEKRGTPPQTMEEVHENLEAVRHIHVEETLQLLTGVIFDNLSMAGFNFVPEDESYLKDVALTFEAMKSMLYKYHGIDYPMQEFAENIFSLQDDGTVVYKNDDEITEEEKA